MMLSTGQSAPDCTLLSQPVSRASRTLLYQKLITSLGNDNRDACDYSPAAAERAVTVGASTLGDERAYFSNHGSCVDVFAPGMYHQSFVRASGLTSVLQVSTSSLPGLVALRQ